MARIAPFLYCCWFEITQGSDNYAVKGLQPSYSPQFQSGKTAHFYIVFVLLLLSLAAAPVSAESLTDAQQMALQVNNALRAESHRVQAARAELQAVQANRLPTITNSTSYYTFSHPMSAGIGIAGAPPLIPPSTLDLPLTDQSFATSAAFAAVPLYTGGKIRAGIEANRYQVRAAQAGYGVSQQEIRRQVTEAYLNVLRARQMLNVAQEAEMALRQHLADAEKLFKQKMATRNVLLAAQTALASATQDVLKVGNAAALAEAAYNRLLGRPLDTPAVLDEVSVPPLSGELTALTEEAFRCRKELSRIRAVSQAASAQGRASHADKLPQVTAAGGYTYTQNSHLNEETAWVGAVSLKWTLFDGGAAQGRERAAKENAAAAARQRDEVQSLIDLQVRSAWLTEQETRKRIQAAEIGLQQAAENLRVVTRQFQEGLVNHTEVLDAQTQRTAAETNRCNAVYDAVLATYQVLYAAGKL
ncbi:MAG: TolC family protein [Planctomycetaceae bacterium]|jgi:outer membrane protein TolC|nr:TolC family protein [Planctomycetaceae bacterium]